MRYFVLLIMVVAAWIYLTKGSSTPPAAPAQVAQPAAAATQTQQPPASSNFIKRPLDRAHAVADMVRKQKAGEDY
jgi:hypothetical protein